MATTKHVESAVDSSGKQREVEVFVFHNPAKRKKENKNNEVKPGPAGKKQRPQVRATEAPAMTMSLESAQKDVRNLGITGMVGRSKIEAHMAQLKSLGAQIPKNWERKMDRKKRNEEFQRRKQDIKAGMKTRKAADPNKAVQRTQSQQLRKKDKEDGVFFDSKVGKFSHRDGVQYISSSEIKNIRDSAKKSKKR